MSYILVNASEYARYKSDCSAVLKNTCHLLKGKGISAQFTLVGSGARGLVTRNGNGPFDLDYNLEIIKAPKEYWNDLRMLKDTVRVALDNSEGFQCFSESNDSTSCLTAILHFNDSPEFEFSFDVALTTRNEKGNLMRLIHNKNIWGFGYDQYVWNEIPNSHNIKEKADILKKNNMWLDVRERYLVKKNMYLSRNDHDHPSFIVYVETINELFYENSRHL